jgi:sialic acid synthase SpsE
MGAQRIRIGSGRHVGAGLPALIVAEIGQNHNGSVELAEQLINAAAWAGADAVKVTKRDLDCELSRDARDRPYQSPHSYGITYGEHRRALELQPPEHARLAARIREHGLAYIGTACDLPSADLLESLDVDAFKIASRDLGNLPLVESAARRGRPVIASTGMSNWDEIDAAVSALDAAECEFVLLQCTSLYPTALGQANLRAIDSLRQRYDALVGFSDHTQGILLAPVVAALGAVLIEKHLTLDRGLRGADHACSLEPEELRQLVDNVRQVEAALGSPDKPLPEEIKPQRAKLGRSLITRVSLPAGTQLDESMLVLKCPGDGLAWSERELVLGRRLKRDIPADVKLSLEDFV